MKLQVKLVFIHHFLRRLLTIILLVGHTIGRLTDFITVSTKNTGLGAELGYGTVNTQSYLFGTFRRRIRLFLPSEIRTTAPPNSPDMPPNPTKKVRLGIISIKDMNCVVSDY